MSDTVILTARMPIDSDAIDTTHWWCCDSGSAICGTDISSISEISDDVEVNCVVCAEVVNQPCRLCGSDD